MSFEVTGSAGPAIRSTTLVVCVVSIILLGGSTPFALEYFNIETGYNESRQQKRNEFQDNDIDTDSSADEDEEESLPYSHEEPARNSLDSDNFAFENSLQRSYRIRTREISNWLVKFDEHYMKPIFTRNDKKHKTRTNANSPTRVTLMQNQPSTSSTRVFGSLANVGRRSASNPALDNMLKGKEGDPEQAS